MLAFRNMKKINIFKEKSIVSLQWVEGVMGYGQ